jgi:hypothetical protein
MKKTTRPSKSIVKNNVLSGTPVKKTTRPSKPIVKNHAAQDAARWKEEYLRWVFVILATVTSYILLAWLITEFYTPDMEALKAKVAKITFHMIGVHARPEPVEFLLYEIGLLFAPAGVLLFYGISRRPVCTAFFRQPRFFNVLGTVSTIALIIAVYTVFSTENPFHVAPENERDFVAVSNFDFYFHKLFIHNYFFVYLLFLFPLVLSLFSLLFGKLNDVRKNGVQKFFSVLTWAVLGWFLLVIVPMNCFELPYTWENKYDFNAVYYASTQVYGGSPMLVDGFTNTYGLYAQLLHPLFKIIGLNVQTFSTVMAILLGLCFIFQIYFLNKFTQNKMLVFLGSLSILMFTYIIGTSKLWNRFDAGFALTPIRWIIFSTLLFLTVFYLRAQKKRWYWIITILQSVLTLWNPEIGLVCFIGWVALVCYLNFYTPEKKIAYLRLLTLVAKSVAVLIAVFLLYASLIKLSYGVFPDMWGTFRLMIMASSFGYYMLPMPLVHPWNLFVLTYLAGLLYSLSKLISHKTVTPKSGIIFLLSILGFGFFTYYVGRSHNGNISAFASIEFLLLTLFADDLWKLLKTHKLLPYRLLFGVIIFMLSIAGIETVVSAKAIWALRNDDKDRLQQLEEEKQIKNNQQFICEHTAAHEKIMVFTGRAYQSLYFTGNKNRSGVNPSFNDLMLKSDVEKYARVTRDSSFKIFAERQAFYSEFFFNAYLYNTCANMAASYRIEKNNGSMFLLTKRAMQTGYRPMLTGEPSLQPVYALFPDDTTGINKRRDYASGQPPVTLGTDFTVEIVFDAQPQLLNYPVLVSNQTDSAGFSILCADTTASMYGFVLGNLIYPIPVTPNRQNYIAAVVSGTSLGIFVNGVQTGNFLLTAPCKDSSGPLFIGNRQMQYYVGAIREVAITKRSLSAGEIARRAAI